MVEDDLNDKAYATSTGFTSTIPPYDSKAKRELLKSYTETIIEPVDPGDTRKKTIDIQPLIDIKDGYGLKTTARTINGLITAIVKYEEQFYKDAVKAEEEAFVGEMIATTEAALQAELARLR